MNELPRWRSMKASAVPFRLGVPDQPVEVRADTSDDGNLFRLKVLTRKHTSDDLVWNVFVIEAPGILVCMTAGETLGDAERRAASLLKRKLEWSQVAT